MSAIILRRASLLSLTMICLPITSGLCQDLPVSAVLSNDEVTALARLALKGIEQEYPNKPSNVLNDPDDVLSPRQMHPAFYGCFDWHSSVHGHWMLVRLLKLYPKSSVAEETRQLLNRQLTEENMIAEAGYFRQKHNRSFERMYGWAWLLQLVRELHTFDDSDARQWRQNLKPLEQVIVQHAKDYLPKLSYPIRVGTHTDTAFALGMELDYARTVKDAEFQELIIRKAREFYLKDRNYPAHYEPSGHDFFSSGLNEADLMRRVLTPTEFAAWLQQFLPGLESNALGTMLEPVEVSDVTDGHLVHLAGLDLARAWTMTGVASALEESDGRKTVLQNAVEPHLRAGMSYVNSGHYEGEHWLATFAVYHLTGSGLEAGRSMP